MIASFLVGRWVWKRKRRGTDEADGEGSALFATGERYAGEKHESGEQPTLTGYFHRLC
jgi:hypothetical protein